MKLNVSLSGSDFILLDQCVERDGLTSRSAGIQNATRLFGKADFQDAHAEARSSWDASDDVATWDNAVVDGINRGEDAAR